MKRATAGAESLAKFYAESLTHLLRLSPKVDAFVDSRGSIQLGKEIRDFNRVFEMAEKSLRLIDRSTRVFLRCRGGRRELNRLAKAKRQAQVAAARSPSTLKRQVARWIANGVFSRRFVYGIDLPFELSEEENAAVDRHFESPKKAPVATTAQAEADGGEIAASPLALAARLTRLLSEPEPDAIAVYNVLEAISSELMSVVVRVLRKTTSDTARVRVALVLTTRWVGLVDQCAAGIILCLGGEQRFFMEAEWRRIAEAPRVVDPAYERVLDRFADQLLEKARQHAVC